MFPYFNGNHFALLTAALKNAVLLDVARLLDAHRAEILSANELDLKEAVALDATLSDRLKVDSKKIDRMMVSVKEVAATPDPTGKLLYSFQHPNGMTVENRTVPFGRILIIYESRPDVTIEAAASAFKSGNHVFLKGGKEARQTNLALVKVWHEALLSQGLSSDWVVYLDVDREGMQRLIKENTQRFDLVIPRGGDALIAFVKTHSSAPVLVSGRGNNFVYVHADADPDMAIRIVTNGKSRLSVCNATDKVLVNRNLPMLDAFLKHLRAVLVAAGLQVLVSPELQSFLPDAPVVDGEEIWYEEFLSEKILLGLTGAVADAVKTINRYSGGHSACIVSEKDNAAVETFLNEVDCAAVYHNASTRFTDGGEFGMGAEMAISTQKLHFRGPVGLAQLVTNKWIVRGNGQTR